MSVRSKVAVLAPLAALSLAGLSGGTASADVQDIAQQRDVHVMAGQNGVCEIAELCLYYNSGWDGSFADFHDAVDDFAGYRFLTPGPGYRQLVKNNAAAACNKNDRLTARVFYNSGFAGPHDDIPPLTCKNLANTYNENASMYWYY